MAGLGSGSTIVVAQAVQPRLLTLRTRAELWLLRVLAYLASVLPRTGLVERVCRLAGSVWYLADPTARAAVKDNLRHVLKHQPTRGQVQAVFQNGVLNYWDTFAIPRLSREQVLRLVNVHGLEHLDRALAAGNGAILVGAHLGSLALVSTMLPARGYRMIALVEPIEPRERFEFFARRRERWGSRMVPATPSGVRELLAGLRRGEVVGLVTDRDVTGTGVTIDFFGSPTRFADGAAAIALRTGAPILPAVAVRRPDGTFEGWIEPPLEVPAGGDARASVLAVTRAVAQRLEYYVAGYPEQWTVFQARWPAARPG